MKKKVLKMKGLRTPKPIIFVHGFINGRMKTAALNPESGHLNSAYIFGKIYQFEKLCHDRAKCLEKDLCDIRTNAEMLIFKLNTLPIPSADGGKGVQVKEMDPGSKASSADRRAAAAAMDAAAKDAAAAKEQREQIMAERMETVQQLIQIREQISLKQIVCMEELGATADALRNCFCTYGHGAMLRPMNPGYLPPVEFEGHLASHRDDCEALKKKINDAVDKEAN